MHIVGDFPIEFPLEETFKMLCHFIDDVFEMFFTEFFPDYSYIFHNFIQFHDFAHFVQKLFMCHLKSDFFTVSWFLIIFRYLFVWKSENISSNANYLEFNVYSLVYFKFHFVHIYTFMYFRTRVYILGNKTFHLTLESTVPALSSKHLVL